MTLDRSTWKILFWLTTSSVGGGSQNILAFVPHRSFQFRAPCGVSGFLRKQHPLGNVITEWFSTCAARWYLCNSSSCGAEREGVGKPQRVQVAWQMLDWQRRGMAGHASWNILATTVIQGLEVRQHLGITSISVPISKKVIGGLANAWLAETGYTWPRLLKYSCNHCNSRPKG